MDPNKSKKLAVMTFYKNEHSTSLDQLELKVFDLYAESMTEEQLTLLRINVQITQKGDYSVTKPFHDERDINFIMHELREKYSGTIDNDKLVWNKNNCSNLQKMELKLFMNYFSTV
jgi:hypothetical protein